MHKCVRRQRPLFGRFGRQPGIGYARRGKSARACSMPPAASVAMTAPRRRPVPTGCHEPARWQRGQPSRGCLHAVCIARASKVHGPVMQCERAAGRHCRKQRRRRQGGIMNTTHTAISRPFGTGCMMRSRGANARLAPGGPTSPGERHTRVDKSARTDEEARWQRILDMLDPGKNCGAWAPVTVAGRPVVCTRAPHDVREEHANPKPGAAGPKILSSSLIDHQVLTDAQASDARSGIRHLPMRAAGTAAPS